MIKINTPTLYGEEVIKGLIKSENRDWQQSLANHYISKDIDGKLFESLRTIHHVLSYLDNEARDGLKDRFPALIECTNEFATVEKLNNQL